MLGLAAPVSALLPRCFAPAANARIRRVVVGCPDRRDRGRAAR
ncbi:hypothetical protein [Ornithinimicrobium kibberense]